MLTAIERYAKFSDEEWVEALTAPDADSRLQEYFFRTKCGNVLRYISLRIYKSNDYNSLAGELYEFLADKNWSVLRKWEGRNGASLSGYISRCATNYFLQKEIAEKKRQENEIQASTPELLEQLSSLADDYDDQSEIPPVWQAYNMLNKRDQEFLRLLVIEGKSMLSVAEYLWGFINSKQDISQLTAKRIQGTISMVKQRAQLNLIEHLEKINKENSK